MQTQSKLAENSNDDLPSAPTQLTQLIQLTQLTQLTQSTRSVTPSPAAPRIAYIVKMFPRLSETFIRNEILELERQGFDLVIFSLKQPAEDEMRQFQDRVRAPIVYLPPRLWRQPFRVLGAQIGVLRRYPRGFCRTLLHVLRGRELVSLPRGLRRFCQTCCLVHDMGQARHLHAHFANEPTRLASWAGMICGVSYSVSTHAKDLYQDNRVASPGVRDKLSRARFVIANSDLSAAAMRATFNGQAPMNMTTIYNGVDLAAFPFRRKEPSDPVILSVGRLVEKKGFDILIKACKVLQGWGVDFRCEIIGSGVLKETLLDSIAGLELQPLVRLSGSMPHRDLEKHYRKASVFVLPCVLAANGDRDILPNVLKEAMAIGVPVVTTRLVGIEELVTDKESGLLVPVGDAEALAQAIRRLLTDNALRVRLAGQARKVIENRFDLRANYAQLGQLLLRAIGEPQGLSEEAPANRSQVVGDDVRSL